MINIIVKFLQLEGLCVDEPFNFTIISLNVRLILFQIIILSLNLNFCKSIIQEF